MAPGTDSWLAISENEAGCGVYVFDGGAFHLVVDER